MKPVHWSRSPRVRALAALNAALLAVLALVAAGPIAGAQPDPARGKGRYILVGGQLQGGDANAIYVVDTTNEELVALQWDNSNNRYRGLGYRSLRDDAMVQGGRR